VAPKVKARGWTSCVGLNNANAALPRLIPNYAQ